VFWESSFAEIGAKVTSEGLAEKCGKRETPGLRGADPGSGVERDYGPEACIAKLLKSIWFAADSR